MFTIRFDFPEAAGPVYAGWAGGALGVAPTLETAAAWETREIAERHLANGYGPSMREHGRVVEQ